MITKNKTNVEIYEMFLETGRWPSNYFKDYNVDQKLKEILEYLLKKEGVKSYSKAVKTITPEFIKEHQLERFLKAYKCPEMLPGELTYLAWLLYPEKKPSEKELIIKTYDDLLAGKRERFPTKYFINCTNPEYRACVCFDHLCKDVMKLDKKGILEKFNNSYGRQILTEYKLKVVVDVVFESLAALLNKTYPDIHDARYEEAVFNG